MNTRFALLLAGLLGAGLAQAQSHSTANYSNPPNAQADSKAGTAATPGQSATSGSQDARHKDTNKPNGKTKKVGKGKRSSKPATDSAATNQPKPGAEATMQRDPSEVQVDPVQQHAFDTTPAKR